MGHNVSHETEELGVKWLFGAGLVAVLFTCFLVCMDDLLTNSKGEIILRKKLEEIRSAQTSLPSRVTDERQTQPAHYEVNATASGESH